MSRFLVSFHASDWIEADSKEDALDIMYEQVCEMRRHEWNTTVQDEEPARAWTRYVPNVAISEV